MSPRKHRSCIRHRMYLTRLYACQNWLETQLKCVACQLDPAVSQRDARTVRSGLFTMKPQRPRRLAAGSMANLEKLNVTMRPFGGLNYWNQMTRPHQN